MATDNGGYAYPFEERNDDGSHHHSHLGITFRDLAALRAMEVAGPYMVNHSPKRAAEIVYDVADAMVAEKRKRDNG